MRSVVSPGGEESVVLMDFTHTGGTKVKGGSWAGHPSSPTINDDPERHHGIYSEETGFLALSNAAASSPQNNLYACIQPS